MIKKLLTVGLILSSLDIYAYDLKVAFDLNDHQVPYEIYSNSGSIGNEELKLSTEIWNQYGSIFLEPIVDQKAPLYADKKNDFLGILSSEAFEFYSKNNCSLSGDIALYCPERFLGLHIHRTGEIVIAEDSFVPNESIFLQVTLLHELGHSLGMDHAFKENSKMNYGGGEANNSYWNDTDLWPYDIAFIRRQLPNAVKPDIDDVIVRNFYASNTEESKWYYVTHSNISTGEISREIHVKDGEDIEVCYHIGNFDNLPELVTVSISLESVNGTFSEEVFRVNKLVEGESDSVVCEEFSISGHANGIYTVAVNALNDHDQTPANNKVNVGKIVVKNELDLPEPPILISPGNRLANDFQIVEVATPSFHWNLVTDATKYDLHLSKEPYGSDNLVYQNTNLTGTSLTLPSDVLEDGVQYAWNMRAYNSSGYSDYSDPLYFKVNLDSSPPTGNTGNPTPPFLLWPGSVVQNGIVISTTSPVFSWNHGENNERYGLYVRRLSDNQLVVFEENISGDQSLFIAPSGTFEDGEQYRWNMSTFNANGVESSISNTYYFNVELPTGEQPNLTLVSSEVDDSQGNNDGILNPGEDIDFDVVLKNIGDTTATSIFGELSSNHNCVSITDPTQNWSDLEPSEQKGSIGNFDFNITNSCPSGSNLGFELRVTSVEGTWVFNLVLQVQGDNDSSPALRYSDYEIVADNGNSDGKVDPGEDIDLDISIQNYGEATATGIVGVISSTDSCVTISDKDRSWFDIESGEIGVNTGNFDFQVSSNCQRGKELVFKIDISSNESSWTDTFSIPISTEGPQLRYLDHAISRDIGNSDGIVNPGEDIDIDIFVENFGDEIAKDVRGIISSNDSCITITNDDGRWLDIPANDSRVSRASFDFQVSQGCQPDRDLDFQLKMSSAEGNWITSFSVFLSDFPKPDLVVEDEFVTNNDINIGDQTQLKVIVKNVGTADAGASQLRSYISDDHIISTDDTELANQPTIAIDVDGVDHETETLTIDRPAGTYWLGACVDPVFDEKDTSNNCSIGVEITVVEGQKQFDLAVIGELLIDTTTAPEQSGPADIYAGIDVRNLSGDKSVITFVDFKITDDVLIAPLSPIVSSPIQALEAGTLGVRITGQFLEPSVDGQYFIQACVREEEGDTDIANNCSEFKPYRVGHEPEPPLDPANDDLCFPVRSSRSEVVVICL